MAEQIDPALRYQIISGAFSPALHHLREMQVGEQEDELRLQAVSPPHDLEGLMEEVDRRAAVMEQWWAERPQGHNCTPRAAALQSVFHDVARGVL